MEVFKVFNFLKFSFIDAIDIIVVGLILYYIYRLLRGTVAINIFLGIVIIFGIWKLTQILEMELLSGILGQFIGMGLIALVVVFQQEVRKFLLVLGSSKITKYKEFFKKIPFSKKETANFMANHTATILVSACQKMGDEKTGALLILERNQSLDFVKVSGDKMNIELNLPILESIFYKNSPLHDGALVIEGNYIVATRVVLPVVTQIVIPKKYGLRHRAAISFTEKTDAVALVVSEETGKVSYIKNGEFIPYQSFEDLIEKVEKDLLF